MALKEAKPILYTCYLSDASWRVRIALAWKGIECVFKYIDMGEDEQLSEAYAAINPSKRLPCFITKTGKTITQSLAIIEYLEAVYPERPMLPKGPLHKAEAMSITYDISCDIQPIQVSTILKYVDVNVEKREIFAKRVITSGFESLEKRLEGLSGTYCVGDHISIADFCLVPMVFNATKLHNIDIKSYPYIMRIRNTLMTLPEFRDTHPYTQLDCPDDCKGIIQ